MFNNGLKNEFDIIKYLHNKKVTDLSDNWKRALSKVFKYFDEDTRHFVTSRKVDGVDKGDIFVGFRRQLRSISIKSGEDVTLHGERLSTFCGFLKWLGISDESIDTLKLYHFGDGTLDGTGDVHYDVNTLKEMYKDRIKAFNEEVNNPIYLKKIYDRFIWRGTLTQKVGCDFIYYGNVEQGIMVECIPLVEYLLKQPIPYSNSIHFGPLYYLPKYRGLKKFDPENKGRYYINIKWPRMLEELVVYLESKKE